MILKNTKHNNLLKHCLAVIVLVAFFSFLGFSLPNYAYAIEKGGNAGEQPGGSQEDTAGDDQENSPDMEDTAGDDQENSPAAEDIADEDRKENLAIEEVSIDRDTQITVDEIAVDTSLDAITDEEGVALEVKVIVENESDREVIREKYTLKEDFEIRSDLYMVDIEGDIGTEDNPFSKDVELALEFDEDLINPAMAYWDREVEEWVILDSDILDSNHLVASFDNLEGLILCVLDDMSTRVREEINAETGGTVVNELEDITIILDIPADAIEEDIEVAITEVIVTEYIEKMTTQEGKFKIDGKIYDFKALTIEDGEKIGTIDNPFGQPITITLECSADAENPVIAWFNPKTGQWEEVETVRIDDTHVQATIYHFSKWAVLEAVSATELVAEVAENVGETEVAEDIIVGAEEESTENSFIQIFMNILNKILNLFK